MYKIDRRGAGGGVQKSLSRKLPFNVGGRLFLLKTFAPTYVFSIEVIDENKM